MSWAVTLGVLAGTVSLVLASVVYRAESKRPDNRLYAVIALLGAVEILVCATGKATPGAWLQGSWTRVVFGIEATIAGLMPAFAYAFPSGRRPPISLGLVAAATSLAGFALAAGVGLPSVGYGFAPVLLLGPYLLTVVVLLQPTRIAVRRSAYAIPEVQRSALLLVAGIVVVRWLLALVLQVTSEPLVSRFGVFSSTVRHHELLTAIQQVAIGVVILRYHLLGVRRVFRAAVGPLLVALLVALHVGAVVGSSGWLLLTFGPGGLALAAVFPPMVATWALWTFRDTLRKASVALDPQRLARRELVERVLGVTRQVVDPEAVLSMVRGAIVEVLPGGQVDFWRSPSLTLLADISRVAPEILVRRLREGGEPFIVAAQLLERFPEIRGAWPGHEQSVLVSVQREGRMYGVFELRTSGSIDGDDLMTVSALSEHLAVKLENLELYSSLGRAGRELERVKTFLENLIESLPVGIVGLMGPDLRVRLWNPAEAKRTGISKDVALGKRYLEDVAPPHIGPAVADAIRRGTRKVLSFPNVGWCKEASGSSVDVTVAPLQPKGQSEPAGYVLIVVDTTERNALHREVEESRQLAALGQFAAAIAHDIRTPLSSIRMSVQILRSKVDLPTEDMEYFDLTLEAITRLGRDVEELLDFTKPVVLRIDDVEVAGLFDDVVDTTRALAEAKDVEVRTIVAPGARVPVDEVRARQMLVNLIENGVRASSPGSILTLAAETNSPDEVVLSVADQGVGIEPGNLERIWEPFFTTQPDGTGLGLAIARKTVTAHGGTVDVESELGMGTRFEVRLPASRATEVVVPIEECRRMALQTQSSGGVRPLGSMPSAAQRR